MRFIFADFLTLALQPELQQPKRVGASIDADGKSNIWAVEPKIQVAPAAGHRSINNCFIA
jgi:hypothetical protein